MALRIQAPGVLVAIVLMLAACGADPSPSTTAPTTPRASAAASPTASPTPRPSPEPSVASVDELAPGDCFGSVHEPVIEVAVVDCGEPHVHEVFGVLEHEAARGDDYPGHDALTRYADDVCLRPFEDYVAVDYLASAYWITSIVPSEARWAGGDRRIVCTLRLGEEGRETTGSAQGSGE